MRRIQINSHIQIALASHCFNLPGTSDNWNCTEDASRTWGRYDVMLVQYHGSSMEMQEQRQITPMPAAPAHTKLPRSDGAEFGDCPAQNHTTTLACFRLEIQTSCLWSKPADLVGLCYGKRELLLGKEGLSPLLSATSSQTKCWPESKGAGFPFSSGQDSRGWKAIRK